MATSGREKVQAASVVTDRVLADIRSASSRIDRLEADAMPNAEGVLTNPLEVAEYCENVAADLIRAGKLIRETAWPSDKDYYEGEGLEISA
jgi:hypothetical protein